MRKFIAVVRIVLLVAVSLGAMVGLMLWLAGSFTAKVAPGGPAPLDKPDRQLPIHTVQAVTVNVISEATGAIQAEHQIALSSKLPAPAQIVAIPVTAGQVVRPGDVLIQLNDAQYVAQMNQAQAALRQAEDDHTRIARLAANNQATQRELTQAKNALASAKARVDEAKTVLDYTRIRVPDGKAAATQPDHAYIIIDKYAEAGDTVQPGQVLIKLYDRLQMIATVPESMSRHLKVGDRVAVHVDAVNRSCIGRVDQIVPQADIVSRTFQVKVTGPCQAGVMLNMFARLKVPVGQRQEIRIPDSAVRRVGQLTSVFLVQPDGQLIRQFVRLGESLDGQVVVVSGLSEGDRIVADASKVKVDSGQ